MKAIVLQFLLSDKFCEIPPMHVFVVRGSLVRTDITCLAMIVYRAAGDPLVVRFFVQHSRRLSVMPYRLRFDNLSSMTCVSVIRRFSPRVFILVTRDCGFRCLKCDYRVEHIFIIIFFF